MLIKRIFIPILLFFAFMGNAEAQDKGQRDDIIQISGYIYSNDSSLNVLPYVRVMVKGTNRGILADESGFFSIAVLDTDTLFFSTLGYAPESYYFKPSDRQKSSVTTAILLSPTSYQLNAVTVRGMTRGTFKREFLALRVPDDFSPNAFVDVEDLGKNFGSLTPGTSPGITLSPSELIKKIPFVQRAIFRKRAKEIQNDPNVTIPDME